MKRTIALILALLLSTSAWAARLSKEESDEIEKAKNAAIDFFNQGEYEKALPLLERVLKIDPEDKTAKRYILIFKRQIVEPYCKQAADAYMAGNYPEAISHWENILKVNPIDRRVSNLIEETISISNDSIIKSLYANASRLIKEGNFELAVSELEKILIVRPDELRAREMLESTQRTLSDSVIKEYYDKAELYMQQKEYDLAMEEWNKVLEIDPRQDMAARMVASVHRKKLDEMYSRAADLYKEGNYIASRDTYNRILAENPTDQKIKGIALRLSDVVQVVPQIKDEGKVWDILKRGLYHHISDQGNPKVAVTAGWYAAQLEPENTLVLAIRDYLENKLASEIRGMEAPVKDMNISDQYLFAALNHIYEGRYDLAIQECSLVLELEPDNVLALKRLGSAYFAMGRKAKAREAWQNALTISPKDEELKGFISQTR